jgi:rhodanese-related sulfurtransferase
MSAFRQLAAISGIALMAAGATWLVKGPPARHMRCEPASLKPDEVCLQQIPENAAVLWVDARSRADWKRNGLPGSVLWNLDPAEDMQAFEAEVALRVAETPRVIVYCGDENCGVSRQVADRIRTLGLGAEVSVLHGGWRALSQAGRVRYSNPDS